MVLLLVMQPLVIVVQENKTVLDDTPEKLGIEAVIHQFYSQNISSLLLLIIKQQFFFNCKTVVFQLQVSNYWEAIGVMAAHKAGIDPKSLRRGGVNNINCLSSPSSNVSKNSLPSQEPHQFYRT